MKPSLQGKYAIVVWNKHDPAEDNLAVSKVLIELCTYADFVQATQAVSRKLVVVERSGSSLPDLHIAAMLRAAETPCIYLVESSKDGLQPLGFSFLKNGADAHFMAWLKQALFEGEDP